MIQATGIDRVARSMAGRGRDFASRACAANAAARRAGESLYEQAQTSLIGHLPQKVGEGAPDDRATRDIDWDRADRAAVLATGFAASLVDVLIVGTPKKKPWRFRPRRYPGSPVTWALHPKRLGVAAEYLEDTYECHQKRCKVPYDAVHSSDIDNIVDDLEPAIHRVRSLGHESLLGWVFGPLDLVRGTGTYAKSRRGIGTYRNEAVTRANPLRALQLQYRHLMSDVYTPAGLPVPFFSLVQFLPGRPPFNVVDAQGRTGWPIVAKEMYRDGYEFRHLMTMALVPVSVEWGIRLYWRLTAPARTGTAAEVSRQTRMLAEAHSIAMTGNAMKVAWVFKGEPSALNWAEALVVPYSLVRWARSRRERRRTEWQADDGYTVVVTEVSTGAPLGR